MNLALSFVLIVLCVFTTALPATAQVQNPAAGLHLMSYQSWGFTVDSTPQGQRVRRILESSRRLGFKTVIFNFRGHMITGTSAEIRSTVPEREQATEERLLLETAEYAKSLGFNIAFRPILLVVGPKGEFPYVENRKILWWHGNIKPRDPQAWFDAYYRFHERYLKIAAKAGAEWYSVGAEMNSMTSGLGDRDPTWRLGYPKMWVNLIKKARSVLGNNIKITYGINYTDQYVMAGSQKILGGELEQWRFYLTETFQKSVNIEHQKDMQELWSSLDVIGLDYYRALASANERFANDFLGLAKQLEARPQSHASQLDNTLTEIAMTVGTEKPVFFQEVGYRSVEKCFLDPAAYEADGGKYNLTHQAAAWEAFFRAFWKPQWPWMTGVGMWQVLVDEDTRPETDKGFTPLGKAPIENVLQRYLK